ncbi:antibiotic biosynthesis monooxygenase family protein [Pseudomonas sp. B21-040]|uniref:antibiotic biosynthesis monooxygenase family protein n=1 Tax=Pseudomonas sp. B21-040 TaxID=2895486 RepID=UPI0038D4D080
MLIKAVSILEKTVPRWAEVGLERCVAQISIRFRDAPGCLAYGLARSIRKPDLWVLSGYWSNRNEMDRHFQSDQIPGLAKTLDKYGVRICFNSFSDFNCEEPVHAIR